MHFISVGYTAIWSLVEVAWRYKDKYFSCTFPFFEKATNLFNVTGYHACSLTPTTISIDILLPAAKTFGLKLAKPTSRNGFNLCLLLVGGGCILSIFFCCPVHTYTHRVVKGPHFEAWTQPEPGWSPKFISESRFRPESQTFRGSLRYAQLRSNKQRCVQV